MNNAVKFAIAILALIALIVIGVFLPSDDKVQKDLFVPGPITGLLSNFGEPSPALALAQSVDIHAVHSSIEELRDGKFQYKDNSLPWTFSVPIDWGKPPNDLESQRILQRLALADPFLLSYAETGNTQDFQQAAFFMLDWQAFHQTGKQITPNAWDEDAILGRMQRLDYILSQVKNNPELLSESGTRALIRLADFHIQRASDPEFGTSPDTILQTPAFISLCQTLNGLSACAP